VSGIARMHAGLEVLLSLASQDSRRGQDFQSWVRLYARDGYHFGGDPRLVRFRGLRGPATTDIKYAHVRDRFDLGAVRGLAIMNATRCPPLTGLTLDLSY